MTSLEIVNLEPEDVEIQEMFRHRGENAGQIPTLDDLYRDGLHEEYTPEKKPVGYYLTIIAVYAIFIFSILGITEVVPGWVSIIAVVLSTMVFLLCQIPKKMS